MEPFSAYSTSPRREDRLIVHVRAPDSRHVQVALYGWDVEPPSARGMRRKATWEVAVYADTEEPLAPEDAERWHDDLAAAVLVRAEG